MMPNEEWGGDSGSSNNGNNNGDNTVDPGDDKDNSNGSNNGSQSYTGTVEKKILPSKLDGKAYYSTPQTNTWIVIHNVGPGTADICYNTFVGNQRNVSTHYTCDDKKIIQMLENNWKGIHVNGGSHCSSWPDAFTSGATNSNSIGIEIGNSGGSVKLDDLKAIEMGIELCRHLMKTMNIDIDHVVRHGDCQNKPCPSKIMELGKWNYFKEECVKRNKENKPVCFDASQLSGGGSSGGSNSSGSGSYDGNSNFLDILPNVDHRYNIANMDKVTGACLVFLPPYNVCDLADQESHFKTWNNWDRKYHYLIDPKYDVDANPDDDIPDLSNAKSIDEMNSSEDSSDTNDPNVGTEDDDNNDAPIAGQPIARAPLGPDDMDSGTNTPQQPGDGGDAENPDDNEDKNTGSNTTTGSGPEPVEDNSIVIKGGFLIDKSRLLQCYGLMDNDKATYINRSLFDSKPTAHCLMIACFIPTHEQLAELKTDYTKVEKNIINSVSKILWANGLEAKDLWREFDMNRAPSPAQYLDRDNWKDLLFEIDKQVTWRNKKFGKVATKYEKYIAVIPDQTIPDTGTGSSSGGTSSGGTNEGNLNSSNEVANRIYKYFTGQGYSSAAACGIIGNVAQESGFKCNAENPSSGAYGLFQWLHERKTGFLNHLKSKGGDINNVETQCEWAHMECEGKDPATVKQMNDRCGGLSGFKALSSVEDAVKYWRLCFERCGESEANDSNRVKKAKEFYDQISKGGGSSSDNSNNGTSTASIMTRDIQPRTGNAQFSWPTPGITKVTSKFGPRVPPCPGASSYHGGIDIAAPSNTDVLATAGGKVTLYKFSSSAGNYMVIDHGNGWGSRYLHLNKNVVNVGDTVTANQVIAKSGATGVGTGAHLHFEIHKDFPSGGTSGTKVDPLQYVEPGVTVGNPGTPNGSGGGSSVSLDKVLLIGDSLTVGMKPVLEKKYPSGHAMGKGGKWAKHWLEDFNSLPAADEVSCVIQWLGINGVHNNKSNISDSQQLLTKLKEKYSGKPIFNMKIFPTGRNYSYGDYTGEWWRELSQEFNNDMSSWCSSNGVTQIDATNGFILDDGFLDESKTVDKLHFTTEGYQQILSNIETAIASSNGGTTSGGSGTTGPLINSIWGEIKNPGPAANLPYNGNSMGGLEHDDWGGKMFYYIDKPEDENAEKPAIEVVFTDSQWKAFCEDYFISESFKPDGTSEPTVNFNKFWELIDLLAGETEPYDKGLINASDAAITPNERLNALTTTFTTDNENVFHFNVLESGPGSKDHCVKAADELNYIITPTDLRVEPIYPDLIIPPQYTTAGYDQNSDNTIPLSLIQEATGEDTFLKQLSFDYDLLKDKKKETKKCFGPVNFMDPYPTDDKIEELEQHYPKVFIDEIEAQLYSCNHPGCPIGQPMAKNFAMLSDAVMNQSKRVEKRLVRLENVLSTIMRNQARLSSRININCVYYGGQSTYAGKYKCIRCMHDDRIHDGAIVTLDQCLNCTRYEPILGQIYQILDESGFNGSIVLDDMQMSYSDLETYKKLNVQLNASPKYMYLSVNDEKVGVKPEKDLIELWKEDNKRIYLESLPEEERTNVNTENRGEDTGVDQNKVTAVPIDATNESLDPNQLAKDQGKELEEAEESSYIFRMNWNETFLNSQQPDTKQYPTEGIIMRFKKQTGDFSFTEEINELDPEKDKDAIEDLQKQLKLVNGQWTDTREKSDTVQINKYSSEKFYFKGFAEIKKTNGLSNVGNNGGNSGNGAECRKKICEMAETIVKECENGEAWYSQNNRTVDYNKPGYNNGKKAYDCTGFVSCCYLHAGLKSMYAKSCSEGTLMAEIVNNGGEMWLMNDAGFEKALPGDVLITADKEVTESDMGTKVPCSHAMIYMGDKTIAHAANSKKGIVKEAIEDWRKGKTFFVRPKDLIEADASAANSGGSNGGGVTEESGTVDGKNYVARVLGAVCTTYTGSGSGASGMGCEYNKTCASHNMPYGTKIYIPQLADKLGGDGVLTVTDTGGCFFDFDLFTQSNIGKVNADVYILQWGTGKVASSYTWAINYYLGNGRWDGLKSAWNKYKEMGGKLMYFTKYNQEDANIKNHPNFNDK